MLSLSLRSSFLVLFLSILVVTSYSDSGTVNPMSPSRAPGWPGAIPLDVHGYPLAPPELQLEQVHVYVRHGEHKLLRVEFQRRI